MRHPVRHVEGTFRCLSLESRGETNVGAPPHRVMVWTELSPEKVWREEI